jgi:hypothetical protein
MLGRLSLCRQCAAVRGYATANTYDVVIVGGGMVGMSLAARLGVLLRPMMPIPKTCFVAEERLCPLWGLTHASKLHICNMINAGTDTLTQNLTVAVVDKQKLDQPQVEGCSGATAADSDPPDDRKEIPEARVSTLTPSSIRYLDASGAWQHMRKHATEFQSMQVRYLLCFSKLFNHFGQSIVGAIPKAMRVLNVGPTST